ncbi:MAG: DinB family protein [Labedaea sp.]
MTPSRTRPEFDADERTQLLGWLDLQRAVVIWKCEGLSDVDAHRPMLPSSPLLTMAGLVSHLRWTENLWFEIVLLGQPAVGPAFDEPEDSDMRVAGVPLAKLVEEYQAQCAKSNEIIAGHTLDDRGKSTEFRSGTASLRWILLHMIEETARHAGHADAIRELLDGSTGYY